MKKSLLPLLFWLLLGSAFFGSSLFFAHFRQTQASTASPSPQAHHSSARSLTFFDPRFPGSAPYVALRVQDRVQALSLRPEELPFVYIDRSQRRIASAQYAWDQGDMAQAMTTLHKAQVYLHRATHECQQFSQVCEHLQPRADETIRVLSQTISQLESTAPDDGTRMSLASLNQKIQAMNPALSLTP